MENASKALIIAGAILLSILLISLGIMVYNNAKNTVGSANLNKQEIETFNSQWQTYEGTKKTASEVKTMIQAVIASNAAESKSGTNRYIAIANSTTNIATTVSSTNPTSNAGSITMPSNNSKTYTIKCGYSSDGLVVGMGWAINN